MSNREYEPRKFEALTTRVSVDSGTIPSLGKSEKFPMTVAPFPDHGRACFVGSAIRSNPTFFEIARNLTETESKKANTQFAAEVENILDGNESRKVTVFSAKGKPDLYMLSVGEMRDPKSLRIYYTRSEFQNAPAVYLMAISRLRDARKVERIFEANGYQGGKNWEKRKIH